VQAFPGGKLVHQVPGQSGGVGVELEEAPVVPCGPSFTDGESVGDAYVGPELAGDSREDRGQVCEGRRRIQCGTHWPCIVCDRCYSL